MGSHRKKDSDTKKEIVTLDERDTRSEAELREFRQQREEDNERAFDESEPGEIVDRSRIPLNHPTIIMPDDTQPPPEATPREGKTSEQAPATMPAAPRGDDGEDLTVRDTLVEATQMGYYDLIRRRAGDIFAIRKKDFSPRWMRKPAPGVSPTPVRLSNEMIAQNFRNVRSGAGGVSRGVDQAEEENPFNRE